MNTFRVIKDLEFARYGSRVLKLDLFIPDGATKPLPVLLWFRGGGWLSGDKNVYDTPCVEAAKRGYVSVNVEYRGTEEGVTAPGCIFDCKAAVRWVRANAATYGIDPNRIGAFGGSAGGHLVALMGTTNGVCALEGDGGNPNFSSSVKAVCDICGPTDLGRMAIPEVKKQFEVLYDVTAKYLGGRVEDKLDLAKLVSPLHHASKNTVPMLIIHGDLDDVVPLIEAELLHDALKKAGTDVTLHVIKGAGHNLDWKLMNDELYAFFGRTL